MPVVNVVAKRNRRIGDVFESGEDAGPEKRVAGYRFGKAGAAVLAQALLVNTTLTELRYALSCRHVCVRACVRACPRNCVWLLLLLACVIVC